MYCTNCGVQQPEMMPPFCSSCGGSWAWICACGNINSPEAKFCARCGAGRPASAPQKSAEKAQSFSEYVEESPIEVNLPSANRAAGPEIEQLSADEIDQLIIESRTLSLADKKVITQEDIDRLFENK